MRIATRHGLSALAGQRKDVMPGTEFSSVEPIRFIPSDGCAPPLIVCDSTFAFRTAMSAAFSVSLATPRAVEGDATVRLVNRARSPPQRPVEIPTVRFFFSKTHNLRSDP